MDRGEMAVPETPEEPVGSDLEWDSGVQSSI